MSNDRRNDYDDRQGVAYGSSERDFNPGQTRRREPAPEPRCELVDPRKFHLPNRPTENVDEVTAALSQALSQGFNVLGPLTSMQRVPKNYQVAIRVVAFSMDGPWISYANGQVVRSAQPSGSRCSNGTWYRTDGGGLALHKAPLRMLANMVGMSIKVERIDDGEWGRWAFKAIGRTRNLDGQWRSTEATKEVDLREGSAESAAMKEKQLGQARINGGRVAEAKAVNAMIRDALGLKGAYSQDEAVRPFVFPCLLYEAPDDPAVRLLQAATELGVVEQVFGPGTAGKLLAPQGTIVEGEDRDADPEPTPPPREPQRRESAPQQRTEPKRIGEDGPRQELPPRRDERQREPARREEAPPQRRAARDAEDDYGWDPDE